MRWLHQNQPRQPHLSLPGKPPAGNFPHIRGGFERSAPSLPLASEPWDKLAGACKATHIPPGCLSSAVCCWESPCTSLESPRKAGSSESEVAQSCPTLRDPIDCSLPWDSPGKNTGVGCHFLLQGDLPDPGIEPRSPTLRADALTSEPPGKQSGLNFINLFSSFKVLFAI